MPGSDDENTGDQSREALDKHNRAMKELVELQAEKEFLEHRQKVGELFKRKEFQLGTTEISVSRNEEEVGGGKQAKRKNYNPMLGWQVQAGETFGSKEEDSGSSVVQRKEVKQKMVKNEKGLWVKVDVKEPKEEEKKEKAESESEDEEPPKGHWRCYPCKKNIIDKRSRCPECKRDREDIENKKRKKDEEEEAARMKKMLRSTPKGEDPRLEAAGRMKSKDPKAAEKALERLRLARTEQMREEKQMGERMAAQMKKMSQQPVVYAHPKFASIGSAPRKATGEKAHRGVSERATTEAGDGVLDFFKGTGAFAKKDVQPDPNQVLHEGHPDWQKQFLTQNCQKEVDQAAAIEEELRQIDRENCIEVDFF